MATLQQECIEASLRVSKVCLETVQYCLREGGQKAAGDHVQILYQCAAFAQVNAQFLIAESEHKEKTALLCSEICQRCTSSCDQFTDFQHELCAQSCQRCYIYCARYSAGLRPFLKKVSL